MSKQRLDVWLSQNSVFSSREKAKQAIIEGLVKVNGIFIDVPKFLVAEDDYIEITKKDEYVGRGAYKLKHAITQFKLDLTNRIVLDIGASTGGFTQVALEHGASMVYALDVGSDQLARGLREDPRVVVMEHRNFRHAQRDWFSALADVVVCDVSFISLRHIIPALAVASHDKTEYVLLIKPQFEAGKQHVNKHGVVVSKDVHNQVIKDVCESLRIHDIKVAGLTKSPITGKDGNVEYLVYGKNHSLDININVDRFVAGT